MKTTEWCVRRLEMISKRPKMWARNLETLELLMLQLVEFIAVLEIPEFVSKDSRLVFNAYADYTKAKFKKNKPACDILKTEEEVAEHMMQFYKSFLPFIESRSTSAIMKRIHNGQAAP